MGKPANESQILWHERQLINKLLAQDRALGAIFNEFIREVSSDLSKYQKSPTGNIWHRNQQRERNIDAALIRLQSNLTNHIQNEQVAALGLSAKKTDLVIEKYIQNLSISGVAKEGIFGRAIPALNEFRKRKLAGMDLSNNVWKVTDTTKMQLEFFLESGLATGRSAAELTRDVRGLLQEPDKRFRRLKDEETGKLIDSKPMAAYKPGQGTYKSAYKNALRMTATEINMAYRYSDSLRYESVDFITGYTVKLSEAHPVYDICDHMAGDYPKGFVFGGWHPNCICYSVPILLSNDNFVKYLNNDYNPAKEYIGAIPKSGQKYFGNMIETYEKNYSSLPYWVQNNFQKKSGKWNSKF